MKDCTKCEHKRGMGSRKKGVRIPDGYCKCIRPGGHCDPDIVPGPLGGESIVRHELTEQLVICRHKDTCKKADQCAHGKLHLTDKHCPDADICYDHDPPIRAWCELAQKK